MDRRWISWLFRIAVLVALGLSAALLADYQSFSPSFCAADSGCDTVRRSGYGYIPIPPLGQSIPVPLLGVLGFSVLFSASLLKDVRKRRRWTLALASGAAFLGLGLLALQAFSIGRLCSLCVAVDLLAVAAAGFAWALPKRAWELEALDDYATPGAPGSGRRALRPIAWLALGAVALLGPYLWPRVKPTPPIPSGIAAHYVEGKINVVEFADFECPFCRNLHDRLKGLLNRYGERVHFVRLHMPLESHKMARPAARAAVCAEKLGQGEAMADHLFATEDLSLTASTEQAKHLGLPVDAFDQCLSDPETERTIDAHMKLLRTAGFLGLPTTYVGGTMIVGAQPDPVFLEALEKTANGDEHQGIPWWLYLGLLGAAVGLIVRLGLKATQAQSPQPTGTSLA